MGSPATAAARAPGRVVLIGDHTDYTGGLVCPMAIDRWTTVSGVRGGSRLSLASVDEPEPLDVGLPVTHPEAITPAWGRYAAGVAAELGVVEGLQGTVSTTVPIGAGLSSSAALELAVALALGFDGTPRELARLCQRAENTATGLPSGILDQLTSACGVDGHALVMDCTTLDIESFPIPADVVVQVIFVTQRRLVGSPYADRVAQCAAAEAVIGPLRTSGIGALDAIDDEVLRRRARHVITENRRVRDFAGAMRCGDLNDAGALMLEGHESLRADYETSTAAMDEAVRSLSAVRGVYGARMTGGGFGGCVVALTEPGTVIPNAWVVRPAAGASRA